MYSVLAPGVNGHLGTVLVPKDHLGFVSQLRPGMSMVCLRKMIKPLKKKPLYPVTHIINTIMF